MSITLDLEERLAKDREKIRETKFLQTTVFEVAEKLRENEIPTG